jgi:hypothetical protein
MDENIGSDISVVQAEQLRPVTRTVFQDEVGVVAESTNFEGEL